MKSIKILAIVIACSVLSAFLAFGQDNSTPKAFVAKPYGPIGQRNPEAPAEVSQYDFVVGNWNVDITLFPKNSAPVKQTGEWHNHWINNGYDIAQEYYGDIAIGSEFRHYDTALGYWVGKNLYVGYGSWADVTARMQGANMVVTVDNRTPEQGGFLNRETYYDITENQWKMKSEQSFDNGVTWVKGFYELVATRKSETSELK